MRTKLTLMLSVSIATISVEAQEVAELSTREYAVPSTLLIRLREKTDDQPFDPFASRNLPIQFKSDGGIADALQEKGIAWHEGATAVFNESASTLVVRNTVSELEKVESLLNEIRNGSEKQLSVILESIEVSPDDLEEWLLGASERRNADKLRAEAEEWLDTNRASLLKTEMVCARSGQRARKVSIQNTPSAGPFGRRESGVIYELDPVVSRDGNEIRVNFSPKSLELVEHVPWKFASLGVSAQSAFGEMISRERHHIIDVSNGKYGLIGGLQFAKGDSPEKVVLQFVRVDIQYLGEWKRLS